MSLDFSLLLSCMHASIQPSALHKQYSSASVCWMPAGQVPSCSCCQVALHNLLPKPCFAYRLFAVFVSAMQASSWREQELLDERLAELHDQKAELAADLELALKDLEAAKQLMSQQDARISKLTDQLAKEAAEVADIKAELAREQALVRTLKTKGAKVRQLEGASGNARTLS